jgi:hypothetical protein
VRRLATPPSAARPQTPTDPITRDANERQNQAAAIEKHSSRCPVLVNVTAHDANLNVGFGWPTFDIARPLPGRLSMIYRLDVSFRPKPVLCISLKSESVLWGLEMDLQEATSKSAVSMIR